MQDACGCEILRHNWPHGRTHWAGFSGAGRALRHAISRRGAGRKSARYAIKKLATGHVGCEGKSCSTYILIRRAIDWSQADFRCCRRVGGRAVARRARTQILRRESVTRVGRVPGGQRAVAPDRSMASRATVRAVRLAARRARALPRLPYRPAWRIPPMTSACSAPPVACQSRGTVPVRRSPARRCDAPSTSALRAADRRASPRRPEVRIDAGERVRLVTAAGRRLMPNRAVGMQREHAGDAMMHVVLRRQLRSPRVGGRGNRSPHAASCCRVKMQFQRVDDASCVVPPTLRSRRRTLGSGSWCLFSRYLVFPPSNLR